MSRIKPINPTEATGKAKDLLNAKIKRRESFRPFAPSILKEYTGDYFNKSDEVPFMEKVFPIKPERRAEIPAVTHVDGTARIQTVLRKNNGKYYDLIKAFQKTARVDTLSFTWHRYWAFPLEKSSA